MATKKTTAKRPAVRRPPVAKTTRATPASMPKEGKDPAGGLTAKGREYFRQTEGAHLRPGVVGPADTPEKMVRKGSFLRRHFTHPRGSMKDEKGEPTRLALSAHAWGEPVPRTMADAKKLAAKGHQLLEQYHEIKDGAPATAKRPAAKKAAPGKGAVKKSAAKKAATKQPASKRGGRLAEVKAASKRSSAARKT